MLGASLVVLRRKKREGEMQINNKEQLHIVAKLRRNLNAIAMKSVQLSIKISCQMPAPLKVELSIGK